jgi:uncharacterized membrane protein
MILILIILLCLDSIYITPQISYFNRVYYKIQKTPLQVKPLGVIICYLCLAFLLHYFIISKKKSVFDAFILGICVYGVYDATNYALLTNYPLYLAIMDMIWGGILFASTTYLHSFILRQFFSIR